MYMKLLTTNKNYDIIIHWPVLLLCFIGALYYLVYAKIIFWVRRRSVSGQAPDWPPEPDQGFCRFHQLQFKTFKDLLKIAMNEL